MSTMMVLLVSCQCDDAVTRRDVVHDQGFMQDKIIASHMF